jgi:phage/plasmid-like protein (TIGR03299 family)
MADRIFIDNGRASMMYVGQEPWHGLGTKLDEPATAALAIEAANLDWTVKKVPVCAWGDGIVYPIDDTFTVVPEHKWGKEKCPTWGMVKRDYTPLQNRDAFAFFDGIVGEGAAIYHTAGALDDGRRVWILAKMPDDIVIAGKDITHQFLLLSNSHDGSGSVRIKFTPIRVVCHNTLTQALNEGEASIRVPHTRDVKERLVIARESLQLIKATYARIAKDFAALATVPMIDATVTAYLRLVFPDPSNPKDLRAFERAERDRRTAQRLFAKGKGNDVPGVAGTLWAAYNGVAEMVDLGRNRRTLDQHLEHIWFGSGYTLKVRAFNIAKKQMKPLAS